MSTPVRTRFAPSPTGFLHVGGVRTALFAWLLAQQSGGQFVLRLEDTDQKREVEGSAQHVIDSLKALGITYDEGPDIGGSFAPYRQSDRLQIYQAWAQKLIDAGRAYADPYTPEEMHAFREQAKADKQPFLYRNHRPENPPAWDGTTPLRFKSDPKAYHWHDEVMGDLHTGPEVIDDIILIKSDGFPTYNFAHIVDDAEMHITHIIRGQEFISSQPNYLNLYEALGIYEREKDASNTEVESPSSTIGAKHLQPTPEVAEREDPLPTGEEPLQPEADKASGPLSVPERSRSETVGDRSEQVSIYHRPIFATMPHILAPTGGKKLGKRDGAKDVLDYLKDGILTEALVNFIASLGWNDGTEQEIFSREELIQKFSLDRVQRSGARFDEQRLLWLNGQWMRRLELEDLYQRAAGFWPQRAETASEDYKKHVLGLAQDRLKTLADLPVLTSYFFEEPTPDWQMATSNKQLKKLSQDDMTQLLQQAKSALETSQFDAESLQSTLNQLLETTSQKPGILFSLIRLAISWAPFSPALNDTLALLGKETVLNRLQAAIDSYQG